MNYNKLYSKFIESRPTRTRQRNDGLETHHILPRSLGGNNKKENLIALTPREHYLAHRILQKMYDGEAKAKMTFALVRMLNHRDIITSRTYAHIIEEYREHNRQRSLRLWQDPEYRAKHIEGGWWHEYRKRKPIHTHNRTPAERVRTLKAKWDRQGIPHNQSYIRSILRQH